MGVAKLFGSIFKRVSSVKHTYRAQVVEAVRISYELAGSVTDHAESCTTLAALEAAIEAAVKAEGQTTMDIFHDFVSCLNDESKSKRMEAARDKDQQNSTKTAAQSKRLDRVLEMVKKSPILRSTHMFVIADPRIDIAVDIPYDAKLPHILWKFHRRCGKDTPIANPHFYSDTAFKEEVVREVLPLRDRGEKEDGRWTERVYVYGDSREGRIRLTSQDGTIAKLFGVVAQALARRLPLTIFKDIEGRLLAEEEVDLVFSNAHDLKCFRWRDSSFEIDPDVRSVQDLVNSSKRQQTGLLVASPLSMGPTDLPQELRHSTSGVGVFPDKGSTSSTTHCSNGSSHVNQPYSTKTPSLPLLVQAHDMGLSVKNTSSNSPLHSKTVSNPPWDVVAAGSSSMVPHHPGSMDPPPRPSHPPPTSQDPPRNHGPWSCEELEAANAQVVPPKETKSSIPANGGRQLAGSPGSSSTPAREAVEPQHGGAPATPTLAIAIPYSNPQSLGSVRPLSEDGSILSLSPAPSSLWSARTGTPLSTVTSPSPGPITNFHASTLFAVSETPDSPVNKPLSGSSAKESYDTVSIQKSTPQPRSRTSSPSPPSPTKNSPPIPKEPVQQPSPPVPQQAPGQDKRSWLQWGVEKATTLWYGRSK